LSIEKHIHTLLFKHECVVVPGFGAFLTNYRPVGFNGNNTLLSPPKKQLTFNASLKLNDGVLAAYVANQESITTEQALKLITERVKQYQQLLTKYGKFKVESIGLLYKQDTKVLFEPDHAANFLLNGFGLESVVVPTTKTIAITNDVTNQKWYWAAAIALPLVGVALWWNMAANNGAMIADLNPFKTVTSYEARASVNTFENIDADPVLDETGVMSAIKLDDNAANAIPIKVEKEAVAIVKPFHVVAGCFKGQENAQGLVADLKNNGFSDAAIIDQHNGLHRVVYGSFVAEQEARLALKRVKRNASKDAWLLIK
jgi:hypothetical protein